MEELTPEEVRELLFWHVRSTFKTQVEAAEHYDCTTSYMSMAINGKKPPTAAMLADIGVERVRVYRKVQGK